jgi:hypothetical protein
VPEGTRLFVLLKKPELPDGDLRIARGLPVCGDVDCYPATGPENLLGTNVIVKGGRFIAGPFSFNGEAFKPGSYPLEIYLTADPQTASFEEIRAIGTHLYDSMIQVAQNGAPVQPIQQTQTPTKPQPPKANWRKIEADNGAVFQIDLNSITPWKTGEAQAQIYISQGDIFAPSNLRSILFDCRGHMTDISFGSGMPTIDVPPKSVGGQLATIACAGGKDAKF